MIVRRMKETQKERAGLGGGSIGEHDIRKLPKMFGAAVDHDSAMDCAWDLGWCYCIRAQRPAEQEVMDIDIEQGKEQEKKLGKEREKKQGEEQGKKQGKKQGKERGKEQEKERSK